MIKLTSKDEVKEDYEEFGVKEIIEQYVSNPYATEIIVGHIEDLEVANQYLKDLLLQYGHIIK